GRLCHPIRLEAARAHADAAHGAGHHGAHALQIGVPAAIRLVVGVADVVPRDGALATNLTYSSHRGRTPRELSPKTETTERPKSKGAVVERQPRPTAVRDAQTH